jgi:hypothetical protein
MSARKPKPDLMRWALCWSNPYTHPPEGRPRELASEVLPRGQKPAFMNDWKPGTGYAVCCGPAVVEAPRRLSIEAKQSMRRKLLARRMRAKNPMFADAAIAAALEAKPDYYGVVS